VTVVEAVVQVLKRQPASRIVVTAPSNTATDHLTKSILKFVPEIQVLRLYAASREGDPIPEGIHFYLTFKVGLAELRFSL